MQQENQAKILIVDDSAETIRLLSGILQSDYRIVVAKDGEKALERAAGDCPPDLVLLDVLMPGIDGYEVCRRLKADPKTRDIPVIFTTILDEEQDETKGFEAGAVDYIGKPLKAAILRARIKTHLELKRHRDQLEELVAERTSELKKANHAKEGALRTKNEFLSCVTHELRTPMSGVIGISDVMINLTDNPDHRRLLALIRSSASAQMRLIDDILEFARLELGSSRLATGEIYLPQVLRTITDMFQPEAHEKGLQLSHHIDPTIPELIWGDGRLLRQVLMNLVGNAVKFTEKGEVRIQVSLSPGEDGRPQLVFAVSDTGIGIADDKKELIFEEFSQADGSSTRRYSGLGLGLSTAKRMIQLMGGRFSLDSSPGVGSRFQFTTDFTLSRRPAPG